MNAESVRDINRKKGLSLINNISHHIFSDVWLLKIRLKNNPSYIMFYCHILITVLSPLNMPLSLREDHTVNPSYNSSGSEVDDNTQATRYFTCYITICIIMIKVCVLSSYSWFLKVIRLRINKTLSLDPSPNCYWKMSVYIIKQLSFLTYFSHSLFDVWFLSFFLCCITPSQSSLS